MLRPADPLDRYLLHPLQAAALALIYGVFRVLPLDWASATGGFLGRTVGPRLPLSERARRNLRRAMPELDAAGVEQVVRGMWDNLGRTAAEFPHLSKLTFEGPGAHVEIVGAEHVDALRDDAEPGIFFSGHLGNWEVIALAATRRGLPLDRIYREANNRLVEWLYRHGRTAVSGELVPKGREGARQLVASLKDGRHLGLLVDQKMNDGIPVAFFGIDAMTAPALGELAVRFGCPVVGGRIVRLGGARFRIEAEPPVVFESTGDRQADVRRVMAYVNGRLEAWVREHPEQWLWLHNRWPKEAAVENESGPRG